MGHIGKKVVAVAFTSPKMHTVLGALLLVVFVEVPTKPEHNHFAQFKLQVLPRQEHLISRDKSEHTLVMMWQCIPHIDPTVAGHFP